MRFCKRLLKLGSSIERPIDKVVLPIVEMHSVETTTSYGAELGEYGCLNGSEKVDVLAENAHSLVLVDPAARVGDLTRRPVNCT